MDDIVTMLRHRANNIPAQYCDSLMLQAADEIERLRHVVERMESAQEVTASETTRLRQRVAELEAAQRTINELHQRRSPRRRMSQKEWLEDVLARLKEQ